MSDPFEMGDSGDTSHLVWKDVSPVRVAHHTPIFDVATIERVSTDGRRGTFVKIVCPLWVTVIPWYRSTEGKPMFVMEQQYRHGSGTVTREFPAGLVEKGEEPQRAAIRELREETGCMPARIRSIGNINPNSAFMSNRSYFFLAEDVCPVSGQTLDENEQLDVLSVPVSEVIKDIGTGLYDNGIMMIAVGFFMKEATTRPELLA
ncbi:MAG: NUDIX hydrolase [Sphaerochaetaceae bacterium]